MTALAGYFVSATASESLAALLFNGFATVFLLPVMLMDLFYFLPLSLAHLIGGKAKPRVLAAAVGGFFAWSAAILLSVCAARLMSEFSVELLYRTWSGLLSAAIGAIHTFHCLIRYRKSMRDYYYAHVLEKNLSAKQAEKCGTLRKALQRGELDAKALLDDPSRDYLSHRVARQVLTSRVDVDRWSVESQSADIHFL